MVSKATEVPSVAKPMKVLKPHPVAPCTVGKKGVHEFVVTENARNTDTYMAKCKLCGKYISRPNA